MTVACRSVFKENVTVKEAFGEALFTIIKFDGDDVMLQPSEP